MSYYIHFYAKFNKASDNNVHISTSSHGIHRDNLSATRFSIQMLFQSWQACALVSRISAGFFDEITPKIRQSRTQKLRFFKRQIWCNARNTSLPRWCPSSVMIHYYFGILLNQEKKYWLSRKRVTSKSPYEESLLANAGVYLVCSGYLLTFLGMLGKVNGSQMGKTLL